MVSDLTFKPVIRFESMSVGGVRQGFGFEPRTGSPSFPTICRRDGAFPVECPWLPRQIFVDLILRGIFLGSLFCSIEDHCRPVGGTCSACGPRTRTRGRQDAGGCRECILGSVFQGVCSRASFSPTFMFEL